MFNVSEGQQLESVSSDCQYVVLDVDEEVRVQMTHWPDGKEIEGEEGDTKTLTYDEIAEKMKPVDQEFFTMSPFKRGQIIQFTEENKDGAETWGDQFFVIEPFISIIEYNKRGNGPEHDRDDLIRIVNNYPYDTTCEIMEGDYEGRILFVNSDKYEKVPAKKDSDDEFEEFFDA